MNELIIKIGKNIGLIPSEYQLLEKYPEEVLESVWKSYLGQKDTVKTPRSYFISGCERQLQKQNGNSSFIGTSSTFINKNENTNTRYSTNRPEVNYDSPKPNGRKFYSYIDVLENFKRYGELPPRNVQLSLVTSYDFKHRMEPEWQQRFLEVTGIEF